MLVEEDHSANPESNRRQLVQVLQLPHMPGWPALVRPLW